MRIKLSWGMIMRLGEVKWVLRGEGAYTAPSFPSKNLSLLCGREVLWPWRQINNTARLMIGSTKDLRSLNKPSEVYEKIDI